METSDQKQSTSHESESEIQLIQLSKKFIKVLLILLCGYVLGWFGLSIAWLLIGVFVWTLRQKYFKEQADRLTLVRRIAADEKEAITCAIKDLPSWVYFPDTEKAEWLNKIVRQMWPYVNEYAKSLIKQSIEPNIVANLPDYLKSFRFEKVDLGTVVSVLASLSHQVSDLITASNINIKQ